MPVNALWQLSFVEVEFAAQLGAGHGRWIIPNAPHKLLAGFRCSVGMTQMAMAGKLEISRAHLAKVETEHAALTGGLVDRIVEKFDLPHEPEWAALTPGERLTQVLKAAVRGCDRKVPEPDDSLVVRVDVEKPALGDLTGLSEIIRAVCVALVVVPPAGSRWGWADADADADFVRLLHHNCTGFQNC